MPESARDKFAFMISDLCDKVLEYDPELGICGAGTMAFQVADLHTTALAEAEARGRRQGLEAFAKEADKAARRHAARSRKWLLEHEPSIANVAAEDAAAGACRDMAKAARSLATTPAETQKTETGESA